MVKRFLLDEGGVFLPSLEMHPTDLIAQLNEIRKQLTEERRVLVSRIAVIDAALAGQPGPSKKKEAPKEAKPGTLTDAIFQALGTGPATIKELQTVLSSHPPKSVDATVRQLAAAGRLAKDDQTPRRFSLPG